MSLYAPNEFMMTPTKCHVCDLEVREDQYGIEHSGHGQMSREIDPISIATSTKKWLEGHVAVWFHQECATVMALRLAHDVMRVKYNKDQPRRVVDELQDVAKVNQFR